MLSSIGLMITLVTFVGLMIAPSLSFIPGVAWLSANAWWLLPLGLFLLSYGLSRNVLLSVLISVLIIFIIKFIIGVAI